MVTQRGIESQQMATQQIVMMLKYVDIVPFSILFFLLLLFSVLSCVWVYVYIFFEQSFCLHM